ncbi:pH-sensitive chloride channel 2-like [Oratosquilla oratoria]|uniref:pH-sensitive chloride channel 2-like n=1 Tax=Oratosquilla oratoria TaxID=337810 RepID=UPI003F774A0D
MGRRRGGGGGGRRGREGRAIIDKRNETNVTITKNINKAVRMQKVLGGQALVALFILVCPAMVLARFVSEDGAVYNTPRRQNSGPSTSPISGEDFHSDPFKLRDPFGSVNSVGLRGHSQDLSGPEEATKKSLGGPTGLPSQLGKTISSSHFSRSSSESSRQGFFLRHHFHPAAEISEEEAQWLYMQLTDSTVYDRQVGPPQSPVAGSGDQSMSPLQVTSAVYVYYIGDINSQDAKYNTIMHITHAWQDPRLAFVNLTRDVANNETRHTDDSPEVKPDAQSLDSNQSGGDQEYLDFDGNLKTRLHPDGHKDTAAIVNDGFHEYSNKEEEMDTCITGGEAEADLIWLPPVYVVNEAAAQITGIRQKDEYVTVCSRGHVFYEYRLQATLYCPMELSKFPFDKQTCDISIESWRYSTDEMTLQWCKEEVEEDGKLRHPERERHCKKALVVVHGPTSEFDLTSYAGTAKQVLHPPRNLYSEHGQHLYSRLGIQFCLQRAGGHYVLDYYLPGLLLVTVSWVSFWLDPAAAPARITLGTSTLLTFVTMTSNAKGALPKVPYVKVLDWWFLAGILFIFCSLIEYAFVNTIHRRKDLYELKKVDTRNILKSTMSTPASSSITSSNSTVSTCYPSSSFSSLPNLKYTSGHLPKDFTEMNELTVASISQLTVGSLDSMLRQSARHSSNKDSSEDSESSASLEELQLQVPHIALHHHQPHLMTPQETAAWIDRRARVAFPVVFAVFNVVYWALLWW